MRFFISNVVWAVCYISDWVIFRVLNSAISKNRSKYSPLGPPELLQFVLCSNHSVRPPPVSYSNHHLWTKFLIYPFLSHHFRIFILWRDPLYKIPPDLLNVFDNMHIHGRNMIHTKVDGRVRKWTDTEKHLNRTVQNRFQSRIFRGMKVDDPSIGVELWNWTVRECWFPSPLSRFAQGPYLDLNIHFWLVVPSASSNWTPVSIKWPLSCLSCNENWGNICLWMFLTKSDSESLPSVIFRTDLLNRKSLDYTVTSSLSDVKYHVFFNIELC